MRTPSQVYVLNKCTWHPFSETQETLVFGSRGRFNSYWILMFCGIQLCSLGERNARDTGGKKKFLVNQFHAEQTPVAKEVQAFSGKEVLHS